MQRGGAKARWLPRPREHHSPPEPHPDVIDLDAIQDAEPEEPRD